MEHKRSHRNTALKGSQLIFHKGARNTSWRKASLVNKQYSEICISRCRRLKTISLPQHTHTYQHTHTPTHLHTHTNTHTPQHTCLTLSKNQFTMDQGPKWGIWSKESTRGNTLRPCNRQPFLNKIPIAQVITLKKREKKIECYQIQNFQCGKCNN